MAAMAANASPSECLRQPDRHSSLIQLEYGAQLFCLPDNWLSSLLPWPLAQDRWVVLLWLGLYGLCLLGGVQHCQHINRSKAFAGLLAVGLVVLLLRFVLAMLFT